MYYFQLWLLISKQIIAKKWSNKTLEEHLSTEVCQVQTLWWRHGEREDVLPADRFSLYVNIRGIDALIPNTQKNLLRL